MIFFFRLYQGLEWITSKLKGRWPLVWHKVKCQGSRSRVHPTLEEDFKSFGSVLICFVFPGYSAPSPKYWTQTQKKKNLRNCCHNVLLARTDFDSEIFFCLFEWNILWFWQGCITFHLIFLHEHLLFTAFPRRRKCYKLTAKRWRFLVFRKKVLLFSN